MVVIIDRRHDAKGKSTVNRERFVRRYKGQIRKAVADAIGNRSITDIESGENISIPSRDILEPEFRHGKGGVSRRVHPGNDQFVAGDEVDRPLGGAGQGRGSGAANEGEHEDDFVFQLSREEFLNIFFEDLALPNLVKTQLARITEFKRVRAGHTPTGVPANLNILRSMRGATGRRIALGMPLRRRLAQCEAELDRLCEECQDGSEETPEIITLKAEIHQLRQRIEAIPFIDTFDLRFNNRIKLPQPTTRAVMFCVMDVSGSMDEAKKGIAKRFFMLLYLFLTRTYKTIDLVFIRHHTTAREVSEEDFFHSRESGGTVVSTALELMRDIIRDRYADGSWNIYSAQASDGDNWENDSPSCRDLVSGGIMPFVQYYAYIEIAEEPQNLWREFTKISASHKHFAMQRIVELSDIYPVFRELFRKQPA